MNQNARSSTNPLRVILGVIVWVVVVASYLWYSGTDEPDPDLSPQYQAALQEAADQTGGAEQAIETIKLTQANSNILQGPKEAAVILHIMKEGALPETYLTKEEARNVGWDANAGNLHEVAPGKSIGGDRFFDREGRLPDEPGRRWFEADLNYEGGHRGAERLVYSNDGLFYVTRDHYETFQKVEVPE